MGGSKRCDGEEVDIDLPDMPKEKFIKLVSNSVTPSVHPAHITWIHSNDMRGSTSKIFFGEDWGNVTGCLCRIELFLFLFLFCI